ncbi:hypothetical protein LTS17_009188 [Exophiala oligosperma]
MSEESKKILKSLSDDLEKGELDDVGRRRLISQARKLVLSLKNEGDVIMDVFFAPLQGNVIKVMMDLGLFKGLVSGGHPQTAAQLAEQSNKNIDPQLLTHGYVDQVEDKYQGNSATRALARDESEYGAEHSVGFLYDGYNKIPEHLKRIGYVNPADKKYSPLSLAKNMDGKDTFEILAVDPALEATNKWFRAVSAQYTPWIQTYPFLERVPMVNDGEVQFVDVGGNLGHQTLILKEANPQLPGRFIVQDLTNIVPATSHLAPAGVEFQPYNFYDEQPVKGAACYYMRYIVHDWGNADGIRILTRVREAMKPGYSKLLINEWVVPEQGASRMVTGADMVMMVAGSGMERTLAQFRELIEKAGLKIGEVFYAKDEISPAIIEVVVA